MNKKMIELVVCAIFLLFMGAVIIFGEIAYQKFAAWNPLKSYAEVQMQDRNESQVTNETAR